jgi:hypothetical protein
MPRQLRIAVSVFFGLATVTLCMLWARGYNVSDFVSVEGRGVGLRTSHAVGRMGLLLKVPVPVSQPLALTVGHHPVDVAEAFQQLQAMPSLMGVAIERSGRGLLFVVPVWLAMLFTITATFIPHLYHLTGRFSLRSLLIATTLLAVALGLGAWLAG